MKYDAIIKKPMITEKAMGLTKEDRFTFEVGPKANKHQIKVAVEELFKVKVIGVGTSKLRGKEKRVGRLRKIHRQPDRKKAIVRLAPGQKIDLFTVETKNEKAKK